MIIALESLNRSAEPGLNPGTTWVISIESLMGERNKIERARIIKSREPPEMAVFCWPDAGRGIRTNKKAQTIMSALCVYASFVAT